MKHGKILVVDDNQGIRKALKLLLAPHFGEVEIIASPSTLVSTMESFKPNVVLLDMNFYTDINTGNEGLFWTSELKKMYPDVQVVLFTAYADIALAVEGMKRGAFDFIVKPWDNEKLISTLKSAYEATPKGEKTAVKSTRENEMFWGSSAAMGEIRHALERIAPTDATVLITGENGTGKDVLAREIHAASSRKHQPMICVDAGAITETLFESELFGHVKGAFTDAHADHVGKFEQANGGTLFLDEIGNLSAAMQQKLLTMIEKRQVTRLGSTKAIDVDIRLICATNAPIYKCVSDGTFRQDLLYRINTIELRTPPLRARDNDVVELSEFFVSKFAKKYNKKVPELGDDAKEMLLAHDWPGNVRELLHTIERAIVMCSGPKIGADNLMLNKGDAADVATETKTEDIPLNLEELEKVAITKAIEKANGNLTQAAEILGITRYALYRKLEKSKL